MSTNSCCFSNRMMTFEHIRTFRGHAGPVADAAFSPDGRWLLSVASGAHDKHGIWRESSDNSVRLWNVATGNELVRIEIGERTDVVVYTVLRTWILATSATAPIENPARCD